MTKALSLQQIFNRVGKHLLTQLEQAVRHTTRGPHMKQAVSCQYRTKEGLTCAVGCLIPARYHRHKMEGGCLSDVLHSYTMPPQLERTLLAHGYDLITLLRDLQASHDRALSLKGIAYYRSTWSDNLTTIATEHRLSTRWIAPLMHKD